MKKRLIITIILIFTISLLVSPFLGQEDIVNKNIKEEETTKKINKDELPELIVFEKPIIHQFVGLPLIFNNTEYSTETEEVERETVESTIYPDLYADFTQEEIYMIQRVVETETYTADIESKMNVASVVFNRLNHPNNKYGDDIVAIITAPNQFAYWRTEISETTIQAVENVYKYGDTTDGCMAYRSDEYPQYWYGWELQFIDAVGHGFYKEVTEGE